MSKPNKEKEIEEFKQYFKERIESMKEMKIVAKTRQKSLSQYDNRSYMNAKWSWTFVQCVCNELQDMWEILEEAVLALYETEAETTSFKERLGKLDQEFRKYKPTLRGFKEALQRTQKIVRNGR